MNTRPRGTKTQKNITILTPWKCQIWPYNRFYIQASCCICIITCFIHALSLLLIYTMLFHRLWSTHCWSIAITRRCYLGTTHSNCSDRFHSSLPAINTNTGISRHVTYSSGPAPSLFDVHPQAEIFLGSSWWIPGYYSSLRYTATAPFHVIHDSLIT
jgi:hypothetical protein